MQRVIFLNRFFFPDHSATSQILSDLAFYLASSGREIHVVTSRQRYDDPQAQLPPQEIVKGVHVHRVATTQYGRSALLGRAIDYATFYTAMRRVVIDIASKGDVIVAKTDPPLLSIPIMRAVKHRRIHLVNWLQDLFPEVAVELGVPLVRGPISGTVSLFRDASLKAASANVVLGNRMAQRILSRGVSASRVHIIHNWSDDENIRPVPAEQNPLRREWGLEHKFVVGYSGNLGRAHEYQTVLGAAQRLRDRPDIIFLFIGSGHFLDELKRSASTQKLSHMFQFMPYQRKDVLSLSLGVPDIHWISLRPELEGLIFPSKFYGIAAAGRPVIAISTPDVEIASLVQQHRCGLVIEPGNSDALATTLVSLSGNPERITELGVAARAMLDTHFTRRQGFSRWENLLAGLGPHSPPPL